MKTRDLINLLNNAAAALECPDCLSVKENIALIDDLCDAAHSLAKDTEQSEE